MLKNMVSFALLKTLTSYFNVFFFSRGSEPKMVGGDTKKGARKGVSVHAQNPISHPPLSNGMI